MPCLVTYKQHFKLLQTVGQTNTSKNCLTRTTLTANTTLHNRREASYRAEEDNAEDLYLSLGHTLGTTARRQRSALSAIRKDVSY